MTATSEFFSGQPSRLQVSFTGLARSSGENGDAIAMVRYLGIVAVARLTVPYATAAAQPVGFEPKNFIDRLAQEKWRKLGLAPSPASSDAEFVRRAYLDAIGTLPTPQEVRDFLADAAADKRDRLVDRLLERPEYAVYWAQQWGDILRNKQISGDHKPNSLKFAEWLRAAFAQNMPFDKFARELIAVSGKVEDHPQMDWYRQLNSSENRVEDTSQVFLGMRVSCAHCHNHPFERISQNDYWQFAAYFAKVDAMTYGPVKTVGLKDDGNITNPRTGQTMSPKAFGGPGYAFVKGEDPRQKLVDWMVAKENPFFARAICTRLWAHYLKRGLVEAVDDMRATNPPTNPALLDALAADLREHNFDLKALTKTIMKSRLYGLSRRADPGERGRFAELRSALSSCSDSPRMSCSTPSTPPRARRRSSTIFPKPSGRSSFPTSPSRTIFLDIFGRSKRDTPCVCETHIEPNLSQVLYLMFAPEIEQAVAAPEGTVAKLCKEKKPTPDIVAELYLRAVSRPPTAAELKDAVAVIDAPSADAAKAKQPDEVAKAKQQATEDLLWTLLNSKEFLFNH